MAISIPPQLRLTKSQPHLQLNDRSTLSIENDPMSPSTCSRFVGLGEDEGIWQERCMILVRERYRRHRDIEKLKKRIDGCKYVILSNRGCTDIVVPFSRVPAAAFYQDVRYGRYPGIERVADRVADDPRGNQSRKSGK